MKPIYSKAPSPEINVLTSQPPHVMILDVAAKLNQFLAETGSYSVNSHQLKIHEIPCFMINTGLFCAYPKILFYGDKRKKEQEYCSIEKMSVEIVRPTSVIVSYVNFRGEKVVRDIEGVEARYYLHECDKLAGKNFKALATQRDLIKAHRKVLH